MKLSVIIPAYNEERNIRRSVRQLLEGLRKFFRDFELLVISDGSTDRTVERTREIRSPRLRHFAYKENRGKGYALRYGVERARGEILTFCDAGGDFESDNIDKFVKIMDVFDADIVIGSKRHSASHVTGYPRIRRFYSFCYQMIVRLLFNLNIRDTQVGLKVFKRKVLRRILPLAVVKKHAFDLELLVIARHLGYRKIFEAPVRMRFNTKNTSINAVTIRDILIDTAAIFYRKNILRWYDRNLL